MSDATDAAVDEGLVERLTEDAIRCSGAEKCVVPLMYCAFGPAYRCDEIAALWLHVIAERDALLAEHQAWKAWSEADDAASRIPSDEEWLGLTRYESAHQAAYDDAERVIACERGGGAVARLFRRTPDRVEDTAMRRLLDAITFSLFFALGCARVSGRWVR